ncbi:hypothetical protein ACLESD_30145 [Pyxidicoccus sp. 3LFB2]
MSPRTALLLLLSLGGSPPAAAQDAGVEDAARAQAEHVARMEANARYEAQARLEAEQEARAELEARIREIRGLFTRLQVEGAMPPRVDVRNPVRQAGWSRLQGWELSPDKDTRLRKLLVTSREGDTDIERTFFFKNNVLFFAFYSTAPRGSARGRAPSEERLYFHGNDAELLRWQHDDKVQPLDGHAIRWGEQARRDASIAVELAAQQDGKKRFEPITCIVGTTACRMDGMLCETTYALFPPAGLPVKQELCMSYPWYAGGSRSCAFSHVGNTLEVTEGGEEECGDVEGCEPRYSEVKTLPLRREMGRVVTCPGLGDETTR